MQEKTFFVKKEIIQNKPIDIVGYILYIELIIQYE